mmetsp:Transcript_14581/g.29175  ORF Transcript_14581/g.29175 Transcript_14581/m.29175 type:complete len:350 (+) Transcript_14581:127-1176(+)
MITYNGEDTLNLIFSWRGTVWKKVMWNCLFNVLVTLIIWYLKTREISDLTFNDKGHSFMAIMVSFLIVTRFNIAYKRFMESSQYLSKLGTACRELIQHTVIFSRYEKSTKAATWRFEITRQTIAMLELTRDFLIATARTKKNVLEIYQNKKHKNMAKKECQFLINSFEGSSVETSPLLFALFLRTTIASNREYLDTSLRPQYELKLLAYVGDFVKAEHGLMNIDDTPFPFPIVQMCRTLLFAWVHTLPFALGNDMRTSQLGIGANMAIIFFVTYGFLGLEYVSMEMDEPFGDDLNDFEICQQTQKVFKDIIVYLEDIMHDESPGFEGRLKSLKRNASLLNPSERSHTPF